MAKTCKNCGNELNDNVRFCPKCGTRCEMPVEVKKEYQEVTIETNTVENEIPVENSQVEMKTEPEKVSGKKSPKWKKWVIGAVALAIIGSGIGSCGGSDISSNMVEIDDVYEVAFDLTLDEFRERYNELRRNYFENTDFENEIEKDIMDECVISLEDEIINDPEYKLEPKNSYEADGNGGTVTDYHYQSRILGRYQALLKIAVDDKTGKIVSVVYFADNPGKKFSDSDETTHLLCLQALEAEIDYGRANESLMENGYYYKNGLCIETLKDKEGYTSVHITAASEEWFESVIKPFYD